MKKKIILSILLITILVLALVFINSNSKENPNPKEDPKCEFILNDICEAVEEGYYVKNNECVFYKGNSCSSLPFNTLEECTKICKLPSQ
tara:strand:- start:6309 stop:6575 length:267 start_codon:yes stop_codon:yes gene_type:complete